ncbi:NAD(P)/FAD-dependent oxidoreductase [Asticcacaulis sp. W401b]|uniref:NAD(P)/FAD-dependent oxidoreductase n=1 Tax=Asticcacaulis sp. W401b TaxID=3388666 RepID=UPI003970F947
MSKHRVVVIGGGFGGLQLVHDLSGADFEITLVDRRNHHLFQPLLYQVATSILATSEIAWPIRHLFRDRTDVRTILDEVIGVDTEQKGVRLRSGGTLPYDTLVLATGATHAYFGRPEWELVAPGLKTLEDATTIRRRVLLAFERAEIESDPDIRNAQLTFSIVGAGPTGVELAGIIAELAHKTLPKEFRHIDTHQARVVLIEAGPRILASFSEPLSAYAKATLEARGVDVRVNTFVTDLTSEGVTMGEIFMPSRTVVWAAGVQASPAASWLDIPADRAGRTIVQPDLTAPGLPDIFVIGDTAAVTNKDGKPVPGVAPAAKQQGAYVAKVLLARRSKKPLPRPFAYKNQGNLATIGRSAAIVDLGALRLKGGPAWWLWGIAHIYFLIGTRSRLAVAWNWLWIFLTRQHSARLITQRETIRTEAPPSC